MVTQHCLNAQNSTLYSVVFVKSTSTFVVATFSSGFFRNNTKEFYVLYVEVFFFVIFSITFVQLRK